jgi:hypothetical protein
MAVVQWPFDFHIKSENSVADWRHVMPVNLLNIAGRAFG